MKTTFRVLAGAFTASLFTLSSVYAAWETVQTVGEPVARHEAAFIEFDGKFYLLGGRRMNPVSIYDPNTNEWSLGAVPPVEAHHFQPVIFKDRIYFICAMTGKFPNETGLEKVLTYIPAEDRWEFTHEIPEQRRRGAAGVVVYENKIYIVAGIIRGHMGGYTNWFDVYDPKTGKWEELPSAPHQRDHFQATIVDGKLYAAGGRTTSRETKQVFDLTVPEVDVYDFKTGKWSIVEKPLPTPRAGNTTMTLGKEVLVIGGESSQKTAHNQVEAYDTKKEDWKDYPSLIRGRHGTGAFIWRNYIYTCSGSGNRGGSPELTSMERLSIK